MTDTAGIIFSVVIVFVIGLITLLFGVQTMFVAISSPNAAGLTLGYFGPLTIQASVALIAFGGWGIASGFGIVKTREWARKSMLAFGAISFVIAVVGTLKLLLDPYAGITSLEGIYMGDHRVEMMVFFAWLAILGAFWLYFFSSKNVKARFSC
jgi:hypothetical protein